MNPPLLEDMDLTAFVAALKRRAEQPEGFGRFLVRSSYTDAQLPFRFQRYPILVYAQAAVTRDLADGRTYGYEVESTLTVEAECGVAA